MFPLMPFAAVLHEMDTKRTRRDKHLLNQVYFLKHGTTEQMTELLIRNGGLYAHCSAAGMANKHLFDLALYDRRRSSLFKMAPASIRNDEELVEDIIRRHPSLYRHAPLKFRNCKAFALRVMNAASGAYYRSFYSAMSEKLRRDQDVLVLYVKKASLIALLKIAPKVLDNLFVLKILLKRTISMIQPVGSLLSKIPQIYLSDFTTALELVKINPNIFQLIPAEFQADPEFFFAACDAKFNALKIVPNFCKREAVLRFSGCLESAPELQGDRDLVLEAVSKNFEGYVFAHASLRKDEAVASAALMSGLPADSLEPELLESEEFLLANFKQLRVSWQLLPQRMKAKKEIVMRFAVTKPYIVCLLPMETFDAFDWIKVVAAHNVGQLKLSINHKMKVSRILTLIVDILKSARLNAVAANTFVFSKQDTVGKKRPRSTVKDLPTAMSREITSFLVTPNYAEMRRAIKNIEEYWNISFADLP